MIADKSVERFDRTVRKAILECGVAEGDLLVVAVSGGPDSLSLLQSLCRLRRHMALELHCAHLDHGLRGEASRQDARFVAETCRDLGVEITAGAVDVGALRKDGRLSLEEAAREARYGFLARVAAAQMAKAIVLGHTADDQAETVLMNIVRGSGLAGLRGMVPSARRTIGGHEILILRPLLGVTRGDARGYCRALGLTPRLDETNLSREPRRNRVRLELLPVLERLNPAVREALVALSRSAAQGVDHLEGEVDAVWSEAARVERDHVALAKDVLLGLDAAVQAHLLRRAFAEVKGDLRGLRHGHIEDMARLMAGPAGHTVDLPGGLRFSAGYAEGIISPAGLDLCPLPSFEGERELRVPCQMRVGGWRVTARLADRDELGPAAGVGGVGHRRPTDAATGPDGFLAHLSFDALGERLSVRARRAGDRFEPAGMVGHKKVQDFMMDARIPREWRDRVPMVVSERGIAWIVGWRVAEWAKVTQGGGAVLEIRFALEGD